MDAGSVMRIPSPSESWKGKFVSSLGTKPGSGYKPGLGTTSKAFTSRGPEPLKSYVYNNRGQMAPIHINSSPVSSGSDHGAPASPIYGRPLVAGHQGLVSNTAPSSPIYGRSLIDFKV